MRYWCETCKRGMGGHAADDHAADGHAVVSDEHHLLDAIQLTCLECRIETPERSKSGRDWFHGNGLVCRAGRFWDTRCPRANLPIGDICRIPTGRRSGKRFVKLGNADRTLMRSHRSRCTKTPLRSVSPVEKDSCQKADEFGAMIALVNAEREAPRRFLNDFLMDTK